MADFSSLKQTIQAYIQQNGNEEITGNILQDVLLAMVSTMGDAAINSLASALQDEITVRQNQDATLQGNISAEATVRQNQDATLQGNISAEATARQHADTALGGRIDGLQTAINGINTKLAEGYIYAGIATPSTNPGTPSGKVFYIAVSSGTYTNFSNLTVAQGINILKYNGSSWSKDVLYAIDARPKKNSQNLVTSGGVFDNIGALDVSELNATENPHTLAQYANLSAAIAAIPTDYQKGGMSIKFVRSSDNKYVQYRLMSDEWNTNVANWQGVDEIPTAGSRNPVESGGVFNAIKKEHTDITEIKNAIGNDTTIQYTEYDLAGIFYNGSIVAANGTYDGIQIKVKKGDIYNSAVTIVGSRFNASPFEVGGSIGSGVSFPFIAKSDGYLLLSVRLTDLPITITKEVTGLKKEVDSIKIDTLRLKEECGDFVNLDIAISSDRVSQAIYLGNSGKKVQFKVSLKSGTDTGKYKVFGTNQDVTSFDTSTVLANNTDFGETVEFTVPSNGYVWLFTTATSSTVRTYNVNCELETSLNNKVIALQRKDVEIEVELNKLDNEIFGNKYTETVSRDRLSRSLYIGHEDEEVFVSMIVESGTDSGDWAIYGTTNAGAAIDVSNVLVSKRALGLTAKFTVPSDGYIWLFTFDSTITTSRTYSISVIPSSSIKVQISILSEASKKPLEGKTIVCFGDSITEFAYQGKSYSDWLAEITGANVINVGIGGTQLRQRAEPTLTPSTSTQAYADLDVINMVKAVVTQDFSYVSAGAEYLAGRGDDNTAIVERLADIDWTEVDYVIVFAGTNDWTGNNGNTGTPSSTDINETLGAVNKIIELLNTTYRGVELYWFTPIVRYFVPEFSASKIYNVGERCKYNSLYYVFINSHQGTWDANDVEETTALESRTDPYYSNNLELNGKTLKELSALIYTTVENNNVKICNLYQTLGWNNYNFNKFFDNTDSTHPFYGFKQIAEKINKFILSN